MLIKAVTSFLKRRSEKKLAAQWHKRHLSFIQNQIRNDARWLSVDPQAKEILERYEKMIAADWYKIAHEDISSFRTRIGLDPHRTKENDNTRKVR